MEVPNHLDMMEDYKIRCTRHSRDLKQLLVGNIFIIVIG